VEAREPNLELAFVAMSYLLGDRGEAFDALPLGPEARRLANTLSHRDQARRVTALAVQVARIAVALEQGAIE
jgi:hypothetical protein